MRWPIDFNKFSVVAAVSISCDLTDRNFGKIFDRISEINWLRVCSVIYNPKDRLFPSKESQPNCFGSDFGPRIRRSTEIGMSILHIKSVSISAVSVGAGVT